MGASMKPSFAFAGFVAGIVLLACTTQQVNSSGSSGSGSSCDSGQCLPGNACFTLFATTEGQPDETKCRKTCTGNGDGSCPFGYTCLGSGTNACTKVDNPAPAICGDSFKGNVFTCAGNPPLGCRAGADGKYCCPESVCVKDAADVKKSDKGVWGATCNASKGKENPDCDQAQGFFCFALSPTDGNAYCTRYDCTTDRDCGAGMFCGNANVAPNATTSAQNKPRDVQKVCQRRDYCSPCTSDLDCRPIAGKPAHCVPDDNLAGFCTPECTDGKNCGFDAKCVDGGIGVKTCYPRAGKCVGDGSICQPCRSDADCGDDGACVKGQYTTEKSCAKRSKIPCKDGATQGTDFDCPKPVTPKAAIRCLGSVFEQVPLNYCHGVYAFGDQGADVGCWTPER